MSERTVATLFIAGAVVLILGLGYGLKVRSDQYEKACRAHGLGFMETVHNYFCVDENGRLYAIPRS